MVVPPGSERDRRRGGAGACAGRHGRGDRNSHGPRGQPRASRRRRQEERWQRREAAILEARDVRALRTAMAPAHGLYLANVEYDPKDFEDGD